MLEATPELVLHILGRHRLGRGKFAFGNVLVAGCNFVDFDTMHIHTDIHTHTREKKFGYALDLRGSIVVLYSLLKTSKREITLQH